MKVAKITQETAELIHEQSFGVGNFVVVKDAYDNNIISLIEAEYLEKSEWTEIEFNPKIEKDEFTTEN